MFAENNQHFLSNSRFCGESVNASQHGLNWFRICRRVFSNSPQ